MICENCKKKIREHSITGEPFNYRVSDQGTWRNFCRPKCADDYMFRKYRLPLPLPPVDPCGNTGSPYAQKETR